MIRRGLHTAVSVAVLAVVATGLSGCVPSDSPTSTSTATTVSSTLPTPGGGTSGDPSADPGAPDASVTGAWSGTWTSDVTGDSSTFSMAIDQPTSDFSGTITIEDALPCASTGSISGKVQGRAISFGIVSTAQTIAYSGQLTADGTAMSGMYQGNPGCGSDHGTWTAQRGN